VVLRDDHLLEFRLFALVDGLNVLADHNLGGLAADSFDVCADVLLGTGGEVVEVDVVAERRLARVDVEGQFVRESTATGIPRCATAATNASSSAARPANVL